MQKKPRHEFKVTFICCIFSLCKRCCFLSANGNWNASAAKRMSESVLIHNNHWKMVTRCTISPSTCQLWRFAFSETIKSISFEHFFSHNTSFFLLLCLLSWSLTIHVVSRKHIAQDSTAKKKNIVHAMRKKKKKTNEHNWKCVTSGTTEAHFNERNLFKLHTNMNAHEQMHKLSPVSLANMSKNTIFNEMANSATKNEIRLWISKLLWHRSQSRFLYDVGGSHKNAIRRALLSVGRSRSIFNEKWRPIQHSVHSARSLSKDCSFFCKWRLHVNQCREQNVINDKFAHWKIEPDKCGSKTANASCSVHWFFFFFHSRQFLFGCFNKCATPLIKITSSSSNRQQYLVFSVWWSFNLRFTRYVMPALCFLSLSLFLFLYFSFVIPCFIFCRLSSSLHISPSVQWTLSVWLNSGPDCTSVIVFRCVAVAWSMCAHKMCTI